MKKVILFMATAVLMTFTNVSCQKEKSSLTNSKALRTEQLADITELTLENIGDVHNEAMSYAYNKIQQEDLFVGLTPLQAATLAKDLTIDYYSNFQTQFSALQIGQFLDEANPTSANSPAYDIAMGDLEDAWNLSSTPAAFAVSAANVYNNHISLITDPIEKISFEAAINIGNASYSYWNDNIDGWVTLFDTQNPPSPGNERQAGVNGQSVAWSDLVGGGIGAVKGAIAGTIFGAGVGAGVGALWGAAWGATEASFGAVLVELII